MAARSLEDRFAGCLLGLAVGDALGSHFEGQTPEWIAQRFPSTDALVANLPEAPWHYTDDTQMAIGVAEALLKDRAIVEESLCAAFVENFDPNRGYGRGARRVLEEIVAGRDHKSFARAQFPGGSYGNGAAMRIAPVGLFFFDDPEALHEHARIASIPTHTHPLGIEGAQLLAHAIAACMQMDEFDAETFFSVLSDRATAPEYSKNIAAAKGAIALADLAPLGNGIAAQESVLTAIGCFALTPYSYEKTVCNAILLGGDTDTIAAMAGAVSGALVGESSIPKHFLEALEDVRKGRTYISDLSRRLHRTKIAIRRDSIA